MANICSNYLSFSGDAKNMEDFKKELLTSKDHNGTLGYEGMMSLFDVELYNIDDDQISFESRWAPPIDTLRMLSNKFNITMECDYDEPGTLTYGRWMNNPITKEEIDIHLTPKEMESVVEIEDAEYNEYYEFEGEKFQCRNEPLDMMVDRKYKAMMSHDDALTRVKLYIRLLVRDGERTYTQHIVTYNVDMTPEDHVQWYAASYFGKDSSQKIDDAYHFFSSQVIVEIVKWRVITDHRYEILNSILYS